MNGGLRGSGGQERLEERDELGRNAAPAGGLAVSANDMSRWLSIQLKAVSPLADFSYDYPDLLFTPPKGH